MSSFYLNIARALDRLLDAKYGIHRAWLLIQQTYKLSLGDLRKVSSCSKHREDLLTYLEEKQNDLL